MSESQPLREGAGTPIENGALETHLNARLEAGFQELASRLNLESVEVAAQERRRSLRTAAYLTAGVGLAFTFLFLVSMYLFSMIPGPQATDAELLQFYATSDRRRAIVLGTYVMPFAGIAFIWFVVALRMWINASVRRISELTTNLHLVSGVLFIALFFVAAGATAATALTAEYATATISPTAARLLPEYGTVVMIVFALRMAAMFVFATSTIGRESKVLPGWFVLIGYGVGLFLLLSATLNQLLVLVFPIWMIVLCVILLLRARQIPKEAMVPERGSKPGNAPSSRA